jgi:hypothetical protein
VDGVKLQPGGTATRDVRRDTGEHQLFYYFLVCGGDMMYSGRASPNGNENYLIFLPPTRSNINRDASACMPVFQRSPLNFDPHTTTSKDVLQQTIFLRFPTLATRAVE